MTKKPPNGMTRQRFLNACQRTDLERVLSPTGKDVHHTAALIALA